MIKYPLQFRLLLACAILATCLLASGLCAGTLLEQPSPVSVDISGLLTFLDTLPAEEKEEQLRDWAGYGLKSRLGVASAEEVPIRHPALNESSPGEISKGRVFSVSKKEWVVLLPKDLLQNKPLIGGLIDKKYAQSNSLPEKISFFSFGYTPGSSSIDITFQEAISSADLFSAQYGYATATVSTLPELSRFLSQVDDIVLVQWHANDLVLGGRSYGRDPRRALTIDEIAAIYQAYNIPNDSQRYESFIQERFADLLRSDEKVADSLGGGSGKREELLAKIRRQFPHAKAAQGDANIGFSLDIDLDYDAFADEMEEFARTSPLLRERDFAGSSASELFAVAGHIRSGRNQMPLIALLRRLAASGSKTDMRIYSALYSLQQYHSYQPARYDGNLQGTQAAMMLFYTDLLAKLWAIDYDGVSAGIGVKGFRPMTAITIPKLYWQGYGRTAVTRLWFGLKSEGFDVYGNKALFQPIATRVYSASSDLLTPGKEESLPNFQNKEFLGWWDRHYEALADSEPEYHKLNQIQKWSCIFMVLKEKKSHLLDFLLNVPVQRNIDFEAWSKNNDMLKTKFSIQFLDKEKFGRTTECLPMLNSQPFPFLAGYGMISGGVTLATQKEIQAKLQKNDPAAVAAPAQPGGVNNNFMLPPWLNTRRKLPTSPVVPAAAQQAEASLQQKGRIVAETQASGLPRSPGDANLPELSAKDRGGDSAVKNQAPIRLTWTKSPFLEAVNFVTALAALQQSSAQANKGEAIFGGIPAIESVVRIKEWDTYLVKTSSLKESWIYLKINPSQVAEYPAKAAGSFADADIFCAKLVSAFDAEKLAKGKPVIK